MSTGSSEKLRYIPGHLEGHARMQGGRPVQ